MAKKHGGTPKNPKSLLKSKMRGGVRKLNRRRKVL